MDVDSEEAAERENESFKHIRDKAAKGQSKAAAKMAHRGKQLLKPLVVGQCATLRVPDVDRGPSDPKNLIVVVLEENDGLYTVGSREGIIANKFTLADLNPMQHPLIKRDEVPNVSLSLRTATTKATGGQGFIKCQCKTNCQSGRCSCLKRNNKCNSRCHPGKTCKNI